MMKAAVRKNRIRMSNLQQSVLNFFFQVNQFPDSRQRDVLSKFLNIEAHSIQIWFQNQRQKWKMNKPGFAAGKHDQDVSTTTKPLKQHETNRFTFLVELAALLLLYKLELTE